MNQPTPLTDQQLGDYEQAIAAYRQHPDLGFACCTAHPAADAAAVLLAEVHRLRDAVTAIRHLHKDSPIGPCPVCIDADAVAEGRDGLMPYPCPTGRLTGAQDFDPPHMRAATPAANRCGATHHRYPETACTEPAGHYQPDRDSHAGPLVLGGREAGAAVWDEPAAAAVSSAAENGGQP